MAKFSVGRLEEGEGSSSRAPRNRESKRARRVIQIQAHPREIREPQIDADYAEFLGVEVGEGADNNGGHGDGSISAIIHDPESYDCPICFEHLTIPVFDCENGHIACSSCCTKLRNKCPSCCAPIGYRRNRAVERILESVATACQNAKYGCKEIITFSKRFDHEKACAHTPFPCPLSHCDFVGSSGELYQHFRLKHKQLATPFIYNKNFPTALDVEEDFLVFQEERTGVLFILHNRKQCQGNLISLSSLVPKSKDRFYYDIQVNPRGCSLRLQSVTKNIQKMDDKTPLVGLLVPPDEFGPCGQLSMEICVLPVDSSPPLVI